jgi:hypothetical protein
MNNKDVNVVMGNGTATIDKSTKVGNDSIYAPNSSITKVEINREKKKSWRKGFSIGGVIMAVVASVIWYIIQTYLIKS